MGGRRTIRQVVDILPQWAQVLNSGLAEGADLGMHFRWEERSELGRCNYFRLLAGRRRSPQLIARHVIEADLLQQLVVISDGRGPLIP